VPQHASHGHPAACQGLERFRGRAAGAHPARWPACWNVTLDSANSALKRARAGLERSRATVTGREPPPAPGSPAEDAIVARFTRAYESADIDALVALLTDDVFMSMPPIPFEYEGRDLVARFLSGLFAAGRKVILVPARANGQPAFGTYLAAPSGAATGPITITLAGDRICATSRFEASVLPWFGLPPSLPGR
jgi:RNA polymerase sigma-70 factor (ECF subfamily)